MGLFIRNRRNGKHRWSNFGKRDGYGVWDIDKIEFTAEKSSKVLF